MCLFSSLQGHIRRAEIYHETQNYELAVDAFQKCFQISASREEKESFLDLSRKCRREAAKQRQLDAKYPFLGAAIGILIAVAAVVADFAVSGPDSFISYPLLKVGVVVAVSFSCYLVATLMRNQIVSSRKSILEPPPDLFEEQKLHTD